MHKQTLVYGYHIVCILHESTSLLLAKTVVFSKYQISNVLVTLECLSRTLKCDYRAILRTN